MSFHKTTFACILHGSATTQLRESDRFYSRYVWWSFLIIIMWSFLIVII